MSTKSIPAVTTPAAPEAQAVQKKPFAIRIAAPANLAFAESVVHARNGYCFSDAPIEVMSNGMAFFTMIQGSPDEFAINKAKESTDLSRDAEEREHRRMVQEEARRLVEEEKLQELAKEKARIKADHDKALRALEDATAAAIAKLK
jgi:cell shape-determining protein MreC